MKKSLLDEVEGIGEKKKQALLKVANIEEKYIGRYCLSIDTVAQAIANLLQIDKKKVKSLLLNNTNESLPTIDFNRKYGEYYYYLGNVR